MKKVLVLALTAIMVMAQATCSFAADTGELRGASGVYKDGNAVLVVEQNANRVVQQNGESWTAISGKTLSDDIYGEAAGDYLDGVNQYALYHKPCDIVKYANGYAVSDTENNVVRYFTSSVVRTLSGNGEAKLQDGIGEGASFNHPTGLCTDPAGNLYIADTGNDTIRMMSTDGKVTTIISGLSAPRGLAFMNDTLYIADSANQRILEFGTDGKVWRTAGDTSYVVSNVEGQPVAGGYVDGSVKAARFNNPVGLAADQARGLLYVGDCGNNAIRVINLEAKTVSTMLCADAMALEDFPSEPVDLFVEGNTLYVADMNAGFRTIDLTASVDERPASNVFKDVPAGAWYHQAVSYAYNKGLFSGTSATTFAPQTGMTRGMFVTVISRLYGLNQPGEVIGGESHFSDVASGAYYEGPTAWAADRGIVSGYGGGTFLPNTAINRQQMAVILYNYVKSVGGDVTISDAARAKMKAMPDSASVESWAGDAVAWAMGQGIINGKDGKIAPNATATRAEVAQIIFNYTEVIK